MLSQPNFFPDNRQDVIVAAGTSTACPYYVARARRKEKVEPTACPQAVTGLDRTPVQK
jgi:hypothetical protein